MTRTVTGSAMYRERIALPPGAAMEVLLEDVSRADAPAEVIASQRSEPVSPPFRFALEVDPARIDPAHAYAVRVRVVVDGELWFLSDTSNPVLTRGAGDAVEIRLRMVRGQASVTPGPAAPAPEPAPGTPGTSTATLEGTYWKLTHLGEAPVAVPSGGREPHLILHAEGSRLSGSGGCNRMTGGYELDGDRLVLGHLASTMMLCVDGMETEAAYFAALGQVTGWSISGETLVLSGADGPVATFASVYLR